MATSGGPDIVNDELVLALDAGSTKSYPGSDTTWYDLSGNGNNGTLTNSPTINSNGYFEFSASNEYIDFGNLPILNFTGSMSHEVWFWRNSNATSNLRLTSRAAADNGIGQRGFSFFGSNTSINWAVNIGGVRNIISTPISVGNWYHIVGIADFDTATQKIYLNGEEKSSGSLTNTDSMYNTITFRVGSHYSYSNPLVWDGKIGPVKVYNKALTASEIIQNYNATKTRFGL